MMMEDETRSVQIGVRFTPTEKRQIEKAAALASRKPADWVRLAVLEALKKSKKA